MEHVYTLPTGTILTGGKYSYRIEEVLGQGGYGITYKVWTVVKNGQIPVKVPFAIKEHFVNGRCHRAADGMTVEYSQEAAEDVEESLKDFVKEGRLLNKICQADDEAVRYIVPVNEVIEANNTAYFVMQYLEGGSLRRMVHNGGAMTEERTLTLIKPIVRAVDFIHRHKVLHMDIKPENIVMHRNLLTGQEEPVLIDFGVSLHFNKKGGLTSKHTSIGHTDGFSPIEQYGAIETFSPWIDVYALGATLYYLLTGKTPHKAFEMTPDDVDRNLPPSVSKRTKAAIKHAIARDYHDRTQSASTFLWELENDYEPVGEEASDGQKNFEDSNVTVKKKPDQTGDTNPTPPIPPTPNWKRIWTFIGSILLLLLCGFYAKGCDEETSYHVQTMKDTVRIEDKQEKEPDKTNPEESTEPSKSAKENRANGDRIAEPLKPPTDAELYSEAKGKKDYATIEYLGNRGYAPAYYDLAWYYRDLGNAAECEKWAQKAIDAGVNTEEAKKLLKYIE